MTDLAASPLAVPKTTALNEERQSPEGTGLEGAGAEKKSHSSVSTSSNNSTGHESSLRSSGEGVGESRCGWCGEAYRDPRVLACFHSYCRGCLERAGGEGLKVVCPGCRSETQLSPELGLDSLLVDYGLVNAVRGGGGAGSGESESQSSSSSPGLADAALSVPTTLGGPTCTGCKSKETSAVAHCQDCANFLCGNCVMAHQYMHCFEVGKV